MSQPKQSFKSLKDAMVTVRMDLVKKRQIEAAWNMHKYSKPA